MPGGKAPLLPEIEAYAEPGEGAVTPVEVVQGAAAVRAEGEEQRQQEGDRQAEEEAAEQAEREADVHDLRRSPPKKRCSFDTAFGSAKITT